MPIVKPISGHTGCGGVFRYLTKDGRALAFDYLNLPAPALEPGEDLPEYAPYDWARDMDATRREAGNDTPWKGKPARTYKHYVLSPDPGDRIELDDLRRLTMAWVRENFADFEVAVVYHDDNARRIPHAHVVVSNTNVGNLRRLQDPDPRALKRSVQRLAKEMGLSYLKDAPKGAAAPPRRTLQRTYVRRAEAELSRRGLYSWVADIRMRVEIARAVAHDEADFRSLLSEMGVAVADSSPRAQRRDWVYSLADAPTRRISGESLGLSYGRDRLLVRFSSGASALATNGSRAVAAAAAEAVRVGGVDELRDLAEAVSFVDSRRIRSMEELRRAVENSPAMGEKVLAVAERTGMLPERTQAPPARRPAGARAQGRGTGPANRRASDQQRQRGAPPQQPRRDDGGRPGPREDR